MNADGAVIIEADVNIGEAEKELAKLRKEIKKTEESIGKQEAKKAPLIQQANELRHKMSEAKAEADRLGQAWRDGVIGADKEQSDALGRVRDMEKRYQNVVEKIGKIDEKLIPAQGDLEKMTERAGELNQKIVEGASASERMGEAMDAAKKHADKFTKRIGTLMKRVLVFSVVLRLLNSIAQWFGKVIKASPEVREAIADLKGALLTLAQPLVEVVIPAFKTFVILLSRVITMIAKVASFLFGKTTDQSRKAAKALNEQMDALDGVGGSAKKAGKSLAGFDEINQLSGDGGVGGVSDAEINPDFSGIQGAMREMEVYMSGALLALGALLTFTGVSVSLGLGLMAVGAMGLASALAVDWKTMPDSLKSAITETMLVLSGASLVVGSILAFSGANLPLGIGLMIAGAAALGTAVALNWDTIVETLTAQNGLILGILSGSLLTIGAILAFCGYLPLGIGLMAAGAVGLVTTAALNWDSIIEALKGPVGGVTALVSGALLVIGAVLAFSGANLPLGIGLMAAGAIGLASVVALNWDFITEKMRGEVGLVTAIASGALLALGLILLFTGVGTGLGIGLILAGAAGLATVVAFNWDFLSDKVKEIWGKVKTFWNEHIAQVFTKEWWLNLAKKCGNGLISGFEKAINGIIGMFETMINWIVDKLNMIKFDVPDWVPGIGGKVFGFNIPNVEFGRVAIPRLAQGAVIPPNREFLAVLGDQKSGTNIETPLATMVQAFKQALAESGGGGAQTIILQIDGREFGRAVKKYGGREEQRVGVSLVGVRG